MLRLALSFTPEPVATRRALAQPRPRSRPSPGLISVRERAGRAGRGGRLRAKAKRSAVILSVSLTRCFVPPCPHPAGSAPRSPRASLSSRTAPAARAADGGRGRDVRTLFPTTSSPGKHPQSSHLILCTPERDSGLFPLSRASPWPVVWLGCPGAIEGLPWQQREGVRLHQPPRSPSVPLPECHVQQLELLPQVS